MCNRPHHKLDVEVAFSRAHISHFHSVIVCLLYLLQ